MTTEEMTTLVNSIRGAIVGTPVTVYTTSGNPCTFKLEDIVAIKAPTDGRHITYIFVKTASVVVGDNLKTIDTISVAGTPETWCKRLNFKMNVINED